MIKLLVLAKKIQVEEQKQQQTSESDAEMWSLCTSKIQTLFIFVGFSYDSWWHQKAGKSWRLQVSNKH